MSANPIIEHPALAAALTKLAPGFNDQVDRLIVEQSDAGTMATLNLGSDHQFAGSIYLDKATETVYAVPTWVSGMRTMDAAVADPHKRSRLAVLS